MKSSTIKARAFELSALVLVLFLSLASRRQVLGQTSPTPVFPPVFTGDANCDSAVDISDPIAMLDFLFLGGGSPCCLANMDVNDDSTVDISDAVTALSALFQGGAMKGPDGAALRGTDLGAQFYDGADAPLPCSLLPPEYQAAPTWGSVAVNIRNTTKDVLVDIPGLGGVRDTGVPGDQKLEFYSNGSVVECSIQHRRPPNPPIGITQNYLQVEVRPRVSNTEVLEFPHHTSFLVTLGRHDKVAWLYGRENDGILSMVVAATGGANTPRLATTSRSVARTSDGTSDTLLDVPGLGGVRDTGNRGQNRKLEIYSSGSVVEWSIQHCRNPNIPGVTANYTQGEVMRGATTIIDFPHHTSFMINIARHGRNGWLFGRENDNTLSMLTAATGAVGRASRVGSQTVYLRDTLSDTLIDVPGLGGIRDTGDPARNRKLEIYSSGSVVEWSIQHNRNPNAPNYTQGEVMPRQSTIVDFPHHTSFMINIARHGQSCWLFGRENDDYLTVVYTATR